MKKHAPTLRAARVASLLLAGVAPAGASGKSVDIPLSNLAAPVALSDEEIFDVSLSTFSVDKEQVGTLGGLTKVARCRACGACRSCGPSKCSSCRS